VERGRELGEVPSLVKRRPTALHVPEITVEDAAAVQGGWQDTQQQQQQQQQLDGEGELQGGADGEVREAEELNASMSDGEFSGEDSQEEAGGTDDEQPTGQRASSEEEEEEESDMDVLGMIRGALAQGLLQRKGTLHKIASNMGNARGREWANEGRLLSPCLSLCQPKEGYQGIQIGVWCMVNGCFRPGLI
jgi:hypothetical protein